MRNKFVTFTLSILFQFGLAAAATADVLVAEEAAILRYNNSGVLQGVFNSGGPTPDGFSAMIRGGNGNVYALSGSSQVYEYDRFTGAYIRTFVDGSTQGFTDIKTMAFGRDGNFYLGTGDVGTVERYDGNTGAFLNTFLAAGAGAASGSQQLSEVMSLAFGTDGMLYVGNDSRRLGEGYSVLRFDATTGSFVDAIVADSANGLYDPNALVFGPDGKLYVSSEGLNRFTDSTIMRFDPATGSYLGNLVSAHSGGLEEPYGFAFGPDGYLYTTSTDTGQILRYDATTGSFFDVFIGLGLADPKAILFDVPEPSGLALAALALVLAGRAGAVRQRRKTSP